MVSLHGLAVISTLLLSVVTATPLAAAPCYGYNCPKPVTKYITKTSYLSSGKGYTSTKGTTVIIGIPVKTVTRTLPAGGKPFTSTRPGTVIIGKTTKYTTKTTFLPTGGGFTSTKGTTVVVGVPVKTLTTTLPAGGQPFTSTRPGTVIIGKPSTFTTTTTYLSTGVPEFTSTIGGTVVIGKDVTFTTTTATIPAGEPGFTSTVPPAGSVPGTVIIGEPSSIVTTTTFLQTGPAFTSTVGGTVIVGFPQTTATNTITSGTIGTTITVSATGTVPGTVIVAEPTPAACSNQGFEYALYVNPFTNTGTDYPTFNPQFFKNTPPSGSGVTNHVGLSDTGPTFTPIIPVYDYPAVSASFLTINHRAYLFAKVSGTYTFSIPASDDITILWVGSNAITYSRANAAIVQPYIPAGGVVQTFTFTLVQGSYTPLRLMWANAQEGAIFGFTITAPDGTTILSSDTTTASPFLVRFSCDGANPPFAPFGQEGSLAKRVEP